MRKASMMVAAGSLLLAGCGGEESYAPEAGTAPETMFEQACAHCHGDQGKGKFGFLLALEDTQLDQSSIASMTEQGSRLMPAFPNLSDEQRQALAAYVREL
ncbi:MAG TPA: cytochrome c [Gammaproteobacteria bacterium]|nr:cytochrome c [Gammaproteobacteria bacterium]